MHRFTAFAGAGVPPRLTGFWGADQSNCLGTEILEFELTSVEFHCAEQVVGAEVFKGFLQARMGDTTGSEFLGQGPALPRPRAQPQLRRRLQSANPVSRDGEFLLEPCRDSFLN